MYQNEIFSSYSRSSKCNISSSVYLQQLNLFKKTVETVFKKSKCHLSLQTQTDNYNRHFLNYIMEYNILFNC